MKKSGFKLRSGNSPMKQNFFKDFAKEMSDNRITRSKAWKATKGLRRFGGRALGLPAYLAFKTGETGFWGTIDTVRDKGWKGTGIVKLGKKMTEKMTEEEKKQHKKNYQKATESYSTPKW